jgi:hypothetical protein
MGLVALMPVAALAAATSPDGPDLDLPEPGMTPAIQRLSEMFSPEIQAVITACEQNGRVDLTASAPGVLICGDGSRQSQITVHTYIDTISDLLAASVLVGLYTALQDNPAISPTMLSALTSNSGMGLLQNIIAFSISRTQLLADTPDNSPEPLVAAIATKLTPVFQNPGQFDTLLGTPVQYDQVVASFCTTPGMSTEQAQQQFPGLSSLQLYAICIDASGISEDILRLAE